MVIPLVRVLSWLQATLLLAVLVAPCFGCESKKPAEAPKAEDILREAQELFDDNKVEEAAKTLGPLVKAESTDPKFLALRDSILKIRSDKKRIADAELEVVKRKEAKEHFESFLINAHALLEDKKACKTTAGLGPVWVELFKLQPPDDRKREIRKLVVRLESCRRAVLRTASQSRKKLIAKARILTAQNIENKLLDQGLDVTVSVTGGKKTHLKLKYILVNKVWAHQMSKNRAMFKTLEQTGFERLIITDGYDDSWSWDLTPDTSSLSFPEDREQDKYQLNKDADGVTSPPTTSAKPTTRKGKRRNRHKVQCEDEFDCPAGSSGCGLDGFCGEVR